jgi:integrase
MQVENHPNDSSDKRLYLTPEEVEELQNSCIKSYEQIVVLLGRCGLRSEEVVAVRPSDMRKEMSGDGGRYIWKLYVEGKNTASGRNKKSREAYVPRDVATSLREWLMEEGRKFDDGEPFYGRHKSRVWQIYTGLSERMVETTGVEAWQYLSSHDLRRFYARYLRNHHGLDLDYILRYGGWETIDSIKPYLGKPDADTEIDTLHDHGLE